MLPHRMSLAFTDPMPLHFVRLTPKVKTDEELWADAFFAQALEEIKEARQKRELREREETLAQETEVERLQRVWQSERKAQPQTATEWYEASRMSQAMQNLGQTYGKDANQERWREARIYASGNYAGCPPVPGVYWASPSKNNYLRYWNGSHWSGAWKENDGPEFIKSRRAKRLAVNAHYNEYKTMYWREYNP